MAAVAATGGSSREARRRRIIERGSDRLALITGRIQSLPPDPDQSRSSPIQSPDDHPQHENTAFNSSLPNQETTREVEQKGIFDDTIEPLPQKIDKAVGSITSRLAASHNTMLERPQISSTTQAPAPREQGFRNSFTTGQISSAISASENVRMWFSLAAAVLVIFSYIGFPILGFRNIRDVLIFRPVYLLLLTNISIVVGRILLGVELRTGRRGSGRVVGGNSSLDQLGKALEVGLMLQKIVRAMFMDISVYVVVLVSVLSLVRGFGW